MRVSVIVPVYNCAPFIAEALTSIFSQDHAPDEVIVVDDGSTDDSASIAAGFPGVTLIRQQNGGAAVARNTGLAASRGNLITWLDADDYWLPGKLRIELEHFTAHPQTPITIGHQRMFVTPGDPVPDWTTTPHAQCWLTHSLYVTAMRREAFDRVGLFNPALRISDDFDWYLRAREAGLNWDELAPVLAAHRVRPDSLTGIKDRLKQDFLRVARLSLQRRRASHPSAPPSVA